MGVFIVDDPVVDMNDVKQFNMAFMMQFFVQHKGMFGFPRLRLQASCHISFFSDNIVYFSILISVALF